jgi:hypothetical protein
MDTSVSYVEKKVMTKKIVTTTEHSQPEINPPCPHPPQADQQIINPHRPRTSQQILNRKHQHQNNFKITTPIKPNILKAGYNPTITKCLVEGFTTGFKIPFTGKEEPTVSTNLKSAKENIDILQTKIDREIASGRVAGPFHTPPFGNFRVSPLGLVPKRSGTNAFRLMTVYHIPSLTEYLIQIEPSIINQLTMQFKLYCNMEERAPSARLTLNMHTKLYQSVLHLAIY